MATWVKKQKSITRTGKLTQPNVTRSHGWNNVSVTHVISNSHSCPIKTACRPPVVQWKQRNAFSFLTLLFLSPPSFPFLPFSQNNSSFVPPLSCASSWRHNSLQGVWFDLLLFAMLYYHCSLDMHATFFFSCCRSIQMNLLMDMISKQRQSKWFTNHIHICRYLNTLDMEDCVASHFPQILHQMCVWLNLCSHIADMFYCTSTLYITLLMLLIKLQMSLFFGLNHENRNINRNSALHNCTGTCV